MKKSKYALLLVGMTLVLAVGYFLPELFSQIEDNRQLSEPTMASLKTTILADKSEISIEDKLRITSVMNLGIALQNGRYLDKKGAFYQAEFEIISLSDTLDIFEGKEYELVEASPYYVIDQFDFEKRIIVWQVEMQNEYQTLRVLVDDESGVILGLSCKHNMVAGNENEIATQYEYNQAVEMSVTSVKKYTETFEKYWDVSIVNLGLQEEGNYRITVTDCENTNESFEIGLSVQKNMFRININ